MDFIVANTDLQALRASPAAVKIQLGAQASPPVSAPARIPRSARTPRSRTRERSSKVLEGADMVFVTAGLGGGTGTGSAPVVASVAKELGILRWPW